MPSPPVDLSDRLRIALRARHYSLRTEEAYVGWVTRYVPFHGKRPPEEMGEAEINSFLSYLAARQHVAASTQTQALSALLFLYREVLKRSVESLGDVVRARRPEHLPVVLTKGEVKAVLARLDGAPRLVATLLYGTGPRLTECLRLRVKDVDFALNQILVRDGKPSVHRASR
jgi:site-specific recombinase XerD